MPELPEVETVRRGLALLIKDRPRIKALKTSGRKLRRPVTPGLAKLLAGRRLRAVRRRGKYLLIDTERLTLINHLGMTGTWRLGGERRAHDHAELLLADGRRLVFNDPRRFGLLLACPLGRESENVWLKDLGREPLDSGFCGEYLYRVSRRRRLAVKPLLMDQKVVVGVGNIYASEALYRAGIPPAMRSSRLSRPRLERLCRAVREVLEEAIAAGGTTLRDFRRAGGEAGYFSVQLRVYDREGEPCSACREPIRAKVLGGRASYWCSRCQRA